MTTPNLLARWEVDYLGRAADDPALAVEEVWRQLSHQTENPWVPDTPEHQWWENKRLRQRRDALRDYTSRYPLLKPSVRPSKRRLEQPRLKPTFTTFHDLSLRLGSTYIFIGSDLYMVVEMRDAGDGDYLLVVRDGKGAHHHVFYNQCAEIDLRTPEPQYIQYQRMPVYLCRRPGRSQKQGINAENTIGVQVGTKEQVYVTQSASDLINGISNEVLMWSWNYADLMRKKILPALRLSKYIAAYSNKKGELYLEYKSRTLGKITENTVALDEQDAIRPWIHAAVTDVGCNWVKK